MPTWNNVNLGLWTDSANWTGGVPNQNGALADFVAVGGSGATIATFTENTTVSVGTLNITSTGARDVLFQGSLTDSGSGVATLSLNAGASNNGVARVNVTTAVGGGEFEISSFGGLRVQIGNETEFNVATAGTTARINAPIIGAGNLTKLGAGTLQLGSASSTFSGIISIEGGTLSGLNGGVFGTANMFLSNNAILRTSGTLTNSTGTVLNATGTTGSGQIMAPTGTTLSLTGNFGHRSGGVLTLGNTVDNGTIAIASSAADVSGAGSFRLSGATIRFDNAFSASSVFFGANTALTELVNGVILDGNGFQMRITNLDLDNGTIRSSSGAMLLTVSDTTTVANAQTGTIEGTANVDRVEIDVTNNFTFAGTTFSNWSANDVIQIDGSANANNLTGSTMRDTFNSLGGNDTLVGNGGADIFFAGDNDDLIVLNSLNGNSSINGGTGTDTLRVTGGNISLAALSGIEAVELQNGAALALSNGQFFSLPGTAAISGTGTISVDLFAGQSALTNNFAVASGSNITFDIQGASGNETITIHPDAIGIITDGGGIDTITGGNRGDTITITGGVDTVNAGAGNDLVVISSGANGSHVDGGADTDTLRIGSGSVTLGTVTGFEAINLLGGTSLTLTGSQWASGFASNTALSGSGALTINMSASNPVLSMADISVAGGSNVSVTINGTSGLDAVSFGSALTTAYNVDGGAGNDQVGIAGNYTGGNALVLGAATLTNVEVLALLPGAGNSYNITSNDGNVAAGVEMTIFAGNLGAGQNFTFNGSAETDGFFRTFGGLGTDTITGSGLSDGFYFGPNRWQAGDSVVGGGGANDQLALDGDYTITVGASADVEVLVLLAGPSGTPNNFNITLSDVWTPSGATRTVFGRNVTTALTINGAAETNGNFIVFGGRAGDTLTGGAGNDQIYGLEGNDLITGGLGSDTAVYQGLRASYSVVTGGGNVRIVDNDAVTDGNDGDDGVVSIEFARFSDQTISITSPIILDLDGGGVETLSAANSNAAFDMDGDGIGDDTSWFGRGEGLLFLDRDGNGTVSNAGEFSFIDDVAGARSDLEGLAAFDSNGDGQLSKKDARFSSFKIWQDRNGDGIVDAREVMTLKQAGVRSLGLTGTANNATTALGDVAIVNHGSFTRSNGQQAGFIDAVLTAFSSRGAQEVGAQAIDRSLLTGSFVDAVAQLDPRSAEQQIRPTWTAPELDAGDIASAGTTQLTVIDDYGNWMKRDSAPGFSLDQRVHLMAQDMASFGAIGTGAESDRLRRSEVHQVELFAA